MSLKLIRQDCEGSEKCEPILLGVGKHVLGRGLPLKCKDSRISRNHCVLEVSADGKTTLTANHVNPCFYTSLCPDAEMSVKILRKGEDSVLINDGDFISLLPDTYKFSVSLIKDGATNSGESETDMETETQEIPDQNNQTKEHINESNRSNGECERDKSVNLSDNEIAFDGNEDSGAEDDQGRDDAPSPSLLDALPPSLFENDPNEKGETSAKTNNVGESSGIPEKPTSEKRVSNPAGDDGEGGSNAKRHRPNSPQDVKPDLDALEALIGTTSKSDPESQNSVNVKTEPADDKEAVSVKKEPMDTAGADSLAGSSGATNTVADPDSDASADVKVDPAQAGGSADPAKPTPPRTKCSFGLGCYRKNALHREEYCHPGDADFTAPTPCQFGAACYRLNAQHRALYTHPGPPAPRPPPNQPGTKQSPTKKRAAKTTKRKRPSYSGTDSEDEYDMEDPFLAADSSDDYQPDDSDSGSSGEDNEEEDEESQNTKRENRRMLREAKKFTGKK